MRITLHSAAWLIVIVVGTVILGANARAQTELVIANRYLQPQGISHSHLYLYREDGKFLRQLTNDNSGQDVSPIFSVDGETIVFTREKPHNATEYWMIQPRGGRLKQLDAAPQWYAETKTSGYFTNIEPEAATSPTPGDSPGSAGSPTPAPTYKSPDGAIELVLREDPNDEDDQINGPGHGKHYLLRDLKSGTDTPFSDLDGFEGAVDILRENQDANRYFLFDGPLRAAFFALHLNSTDGTTVFALDLNRKRLVRLSPNWATPFALPGQSAFLTFTENRYVPIPGSTKTANCVYVDHWDQQLNHIRYAREKTAAICYGFSMYRPRQNPAVITLRRSSENAE